MFFSNHVSNTTAGFNVNVDYDEDGLTILVTDMAGKKIVRKYFQSVSNAIDWASKHNYIVKM